MFGTQDLVLFVVSGLLLNITPGPDTLYILGRTASQGWRGGSVAALGIGAGCCVHITAAGLGLSAVLMTSATAFSAIKWLGGLYLVWLGIGLLRTRTGTADAAAVPSVQTLQGIFAQGFLTNALNPKVAVFFLAFLPQFIAPGAVDKALAFVFLGVVFNVNATLWNLLVAGSAAWVARSVRHSQTIAVWINRTIGAVFVYLGVRLAAAH
jgi:threonine/homoserine/homoserine lactone efflux protein